MALITCPQQGCGEQISPVAINCPHCGYGVEQYLQEDLRGYEKHPAMRAFDHWTNNGDGTVTDRVSGLTWQRGPYGMTWHGRYFAGQATKLDWYEATRRFGCGNRVGLTDSGNIDPVKLARDGVISNGYKQGTEHYVFAGTSGWRLPTIAEYMTLNPLMKFADGFTADGKYDYNFFDVVFSRGSRYLIHYTRHETRYLSATFREPSKTLLGKKLWDGIAWMYKLYYESAIDVGSNELHPFLLVRGA